MDDNSKGSTVAGTETDSVVSKVENTQSTREEDGKKRSLYTRRIIDVSALNEYLDSSSNKGLCGSQNLGNTCFMNSAIQCMSHSVELTTFFLSRDFEKEINTSSKYGLGGNLAKEWYGLLKQLWVDNDRVADARRFKSTISRRAHQFSGYSQHDSHEFMTYFLDIMNEELKKNTDKPYKEIEEKQDNEDDINAARRFWEEYLERNNSVISDLFLGQFKSTIECPECHWESITYDPFITLSLPVKNHEETLISKKFYFIPRYSLRKVISINLKIPEEMTFGDFFKFMNENWSDEATNKKFKAMIVLNSFITELPEEDSEINKEGREGYTFFSEIEDGGKENEKDPLKFYPLYYEKPEEEKTKSAFPRMLYLRKQMKFKEFKKLLFIYMRKFCNIPLKDSTFEEELEKYLENEKASEEEIIKICNKEYEMIFESEEKTDELKEFLKDIPCELLIQKDDDIKYLISSTENESKLIQLKDEDTIEGILDSLNNGYSLKMFIYEKKKFSNVEKIGEINTASKNPLDYNKKEKISGISLDDCIESFIKKEKLERRNEWLCKKCKKLQNASKKMEIFYLPKLLIIHLKRFEKSGHYGWTKNNAFIDFPIDNLDMGKYFNGPDKNNSKYDLYAVSQHYGGCGGGHYTAVCRNNGDWYSFNDSSVSHTTKNDIVSSAAYVLLYRRKTD